FINITVDREERPDVDNVYMSALHALGEQGGWPLTMFLAPDARPFWGGTYFPPEQRYGRPSFKQVLMEISRIWKNERHKIESSSTAIVAALRTTSGDSGGELTSEQITQAADTILKAVDLQRGGLRGAPKFPQAPIFDFLWTASLHPNNQTRQSAVTTTLRQISQGGIYDHLGGGLARYSVDAEWLVPHFEKMLYDHAQFVSLLIRAWLKTGEALFRIRIEETLGFVLSKMTTPEGVFASSYDADSEGAEGKYYVWGKEEIDRLLEPNAAQLFCTQYGVTAHGNWEGHNILNRSHDLELQNTETEARLAEARKILLAARQKRIPPGFDSKVLADWNGLMIAAMAEAAFVFQRADWALAAQNAMAALLRIHWREDRLMHASRDGNARHEATSDGYANLITAVRALHLLTSDRAHIATAIRLAQALFDNHWDQSNGSYLFASRRVSELPVETRTIHDDATANANGVMMANLVALHHYTGSLEYWKLARKIGECFAGEVRGNPFAAPTYLKNYRCLNDAVQIVPAGEVSQELLLSVIRHTGLDAVVHRILTPDELSPGHPARIKFLNGSEPAIYICRGTVCAAPARSLAGIGEALAVLNLSGVH
ncbi:MAG: thioredoxin domain-containing protein, partial [Aestuariivirga sp.]